VSRLLCFQTIKGKFTLHRHTETNADSQQITVFSDISRPSECWFNMFNRWK